MAKSKPARMPAYRDPKTPIEERIAGLVSRMTLAEKISQIITPSPAIPRLGIPAVKWHGECLHGLVHTGRATQFPQAIGLAATFDPALIRKVADAIASEARAKHHDPKWHGPKGPRVGLNFWTPNINIFRDPRWGRGQETYGEDPLLTGAIGAAFVKGLQGANPRYLKVGACAKHYAVHSGPERLRAEFDARVSKKDLFETYLPAFKALVDAGVEVVMASYNRVNGEPCPGSTTLLSEVLRKKWGFGGHVVSDGGAVCAVHLGHKVTANAAESAALCVKAGCDLCNEGEPAYLALPEAIEKGLVTESDIDRCVVNVLRSQIRLGFHDDPRLNPYTKIRGNVVQSPAHIGLARTAAAKSIVLLKNNGILPLTAKTRTVCLCGPTAADSEVLMGNFYRGTSANFKTILEGVTAAAPEGVATLYLPGAFVAHPNISESNWHEGLAENSDVVIAAVGLSPLMEGEAGECIASAAWGDRAEITLPPHQIAFVKHLALKKKPIILVVTGGSPIALGELNDLVDAVLYVWYPGEQGGMAVGDIIFGNESPSGRLPVTVPKSLDQVPAFEDYAMDNRGYRFMKDDPEYPFGFGLSYTTFKYGAMKLSAKKVVSGTGLTAEVTLTNAGKRESEEVVQLYLTDNEASSRAPRWALKDFKRIRLAAGKSKAVQFAVTPAMMELIDNQGNGVLEPGTFTVTIGGSSPGARSRQLGAAKPSVGTFTLVAAK